MTDLTLYGLPHCGTCKKAIAWLQAHNVAHHFVDYRAEPLSADAPEADADAEGVG